MANVECCKCVGSVPESVAFECWKDGEVEYVCDECFDGSDDEYYDQVIARSELYDHLPEVMKPLK